MRRSIELDSLRGVAALIVLLYHSWATFPDAVHAVPPLRTAVQFFNPAFLLRDTPLHLMVSGPGCVALFFVLSGFVLSISLSKFQKGSYGRYITRRFCRIYLPFAAAVLISAIAYGFVLPHPVPEAVASYWFSHDQWSEKPTWGLILQHLLMVGTPRANTLDPPMWSLVAEMRVSLIFPLLYLLISRYRVMGMAAVMLAYFAASGVMTAIGEGEPKSFVASLCFTIEYLPLFALGILLYETRDTLRSIYDRVPAAVRWAVLLPCVLLLGVPHVGPETTLTMGTKLFWLVSVGAGSAAAMLIALHSRAASRILCLKPLQWLGHISYSLYLFHMLVLMAMVHLFHESLPLTTILACVIPLSLLAAGLSYLLIERPAMTLGYWLTRRPVAKAARDWQQVGTGETVGVSQ